MPESTLSILKVKAITVCLLCYILCNFKCKSGFGLTFKKFIDVSDKFVHAVLKISQIYFLVSRNGKPKTHSLSSNKIELCSIFYTKISEVSVIPLRSYKY